MALRVRSTFLEEMMEGASQTALNRSKSAPGLTSTLMQSQEVNSQIERVYCEDLSVKVAMLSDKSNRKLSGKSFLSAPCSQGSTQINSDCTATSQVGCDSEMISLEGAVAPRGGARRRQANAGTRAMATNEALAKSILLAKALTKSGADVSDTSNGSNTSALRHSTGTSHTSRSKRWADMAEDSDSETFNFEVKSINSTLSAPRSALNAGSWGHPELCSRPCLYFAAGVCANAKDCDYCHLPHSKRPAHLDKRQRSELEQMSAADWVALIIPILESRVAAVDASFEAAQLVSAVAAQCGGTPSRNAPPRGQRVLMLTLRAMSLRALTATMLRSGATHGFDLTESLEALMCRLRESASQVRPESQE